MQIESSNYIKKRHHIAISTTEYYRITESGAIISSLQVQWHDATSAFSLTLYSSNVDDPTDDANAEQWQNESSAVPWTGAPGGAAGCELKHLGNNGAKHLLLKIVTSAASEISVIRHGKE